MHPRSPSAVLWLNDWINGSCERRAHSFIDHSGGSWWRQALDLENKRVFLSARSLSPRPARLPPHAPTLTQRHVTAPRPWLLFCLAIDTQLPCDLLQNGRCSVRKFLLLECWMSALRSNRLGKQLSVLKLEGPKMNCGCCHGERRERQWNR